ncbi:MAG: adenosylcobinamide amidohydrolase [Thermoplasma acidophilum]|nr:adenosylcobinamide amidohydrolase [Thermoplasma acidophilum]
MSTKPFEMREEAGYYVIEFQHKAWTMSSAPFNGGCGLRSTYINRHVDSNYSHEVRTEVESFLKRQNLATEDTVVTLTAADVSRYVHASKHVEGWHIDIFLTAGFDNAISIGNRFGKPGTINIAVVTDMPLSEAAMVNMMQSMVEAKSQFMNDYGIKDIRTGKPAPGTSTDTVSLFVVNSEGNIDYAGRLTEAGYYTSMMVYNALALSYR